MVTILKRVIFPLSLFKIKRNGLGSTFISFHSIQVILKSSMQSIKVRDGFGSRRFKRIIIFSTITTKSRCTGLISTLIEKFFRNFLSLFFLFPLFHPGWQLSYTEKPISMLSISVLPQKFLLLVNPIQKSHGYVGGNLLSFKNKFFSFIMAFSFRLSVLRSSILMLVTLLFVAIIETERFFIR